MGKNQSASNLTNIIRQDASGNIVFTSGSTTLATISTTGQLSGSTAVLSAQTASFVALAQSASNAVSAATASFANAFTVASTLTAQTLVVQTITSSVSTITGSTNFGSLLANTHNFTGSVNMTGSLTVTTTGTELQVNSTGVNLGNAVTDTHNITGSARISGSLVVSAGTTTVGVLTGSSAVFSGTMVVGGSSTIQQFSVFGANDPRAEIVSTGNNSAGVFFRVLNSGTQVGNATLRVTNSGVLELYTGGASDTLRLTIASTGAATLAAATSGAITLTVNGTANNWTSAITGNSTTSQSYGLLIQAGTNSTDAALRVRNQANSLDWLFVRGDGNVGIGTISPSTALHVVGTTTINGDDGSLYQRAVNANAAVYWDIRNSSNTRRAYVGFGGTSSTLFDIANSDGGDIRFLSAGVERVRIESNGTTQIIAADNQTTNGGYNTFGNLFVASATAQGTGIGGSISIGGRFNGAGAYATFARIQGKKENSSSGQTGAYLALEVNTDTTNLLTERVRINSNGEFLVGTTVATSSDPVHRIGGSGGTTYGRLMIQERVGVWISLNTGSQNYGTIFLNGSVIVYGGQSDYRLKKNIQPLSSGLDRVMSLKPVSFNWKRDNSYGEGFIAHELQEIVPLAVTGTKDGLNEVGDPDWQNVDKSHIVPILVKAIQELNTKLDAANAEIEELKNK